MLLGEMFTAAGAEVRYSMEADNDDTIASYAQLGGAAVLSRDRDFFRYDGSTFPLFFTFEVTNGDLNLKPYKRPRALWEEPRAPRDMILQPRPETATRNAMLADLAAGGQRVLRGVPSPLVRWGCARYQWGRVCVCIPWRTWGGAKSACQLAQ
jgi:hypothetical protein